MERIARLWAIVLAAGEGSRLLPLTQLLYGEPLPKQFASIVDGESLLQATVRRLEALVPPTRTVVIVPRAYEQLAHEQLGRFDGIQVIAQPCNRGTGPGILLPLSHVLGQDPDARVVVAPSDHHVPAPQPFLAAIADAAAAADDIPVNLLGVEADRAETEYGWIVPGRRLRGCIRAVERFVEKPTRAVAEAAHAAGALWNTFVTVASGRALWALAERHLPAQAQALAGLDPSARRSLGAVYDRIDTANFSSGVLERAAALAVTPVEGSGWSDWGSPERIIASLGAADVQALMARCGPRRGPIPSGRSVDEGGAAGSA